MQKNNYQGKTIFTSNDTIRCAVCSPLPFVLCPPEIPIPNRSPLATPPPLPPPLAALNRGPSPVTEPGLRPPDLDETAPPSSFLTSSRAPPFASTPPAPLVAELAPKPSATLGSKVCRIERGGAPLHRCFLPRRIRSPPSKLHREVLRHRPPLHFLLTISPNPARSTKLSAPAILPYPGLSSPHEIEYALTLVHGEPNRAPTPRPARQRPPPPPDVAASRGVSKAWCTVIDTRRLLTDLLPHSLAGIFIHLGYQTLPKCFSLTQPTEIAALDYLDAECLMIRQHCNGLLLLGEEEARVLNPATREWARLPPPPPRCTPGMEDMYPLELADYMDCHDQYLVFDPTLSPHYQVFLIKHVPWIPTPDSCHLVNPHIKEREWPPSTFVLLVFSSRTYQWEERPFLRQGEAARTIGYMLEAFPSDHPYAVYWRGALYILQYDLAIRIPLSSHKYQVIDLPNGCHRSLFAYYLGKSENGVYCALFDGRDSLRLQIWYLDEMCDQISWMLKCDVNLHPLLESICRKHSDGPPGVQCAKCVEDNISNATGTEVVLEHGRIKYSLLGFHPNEKIVFFHTPLGRVLAYHFDSSKIEDLGCLPMGPKDYIYLSFPYTPCRMSVFKQQVAGVMFK